MKTFTALCLSLFLLSSISAAEVPVPKNKKQEIGSLQDRLEEHEAAQDNLKKEVKNIEKDLKKTRKRLVSVARSIRASETTLSNLEKQIKILEVEKNQLDGELEDERKSIARLIIALERIKRLPPQALIAKPDAPLKTAQSVMLMRDIIPRLYNQAEALQIKLRSLDRIADDLTQKKQSVYATSEALKEEQIELSSLSKKREKLYKSAKQDLEIQQRTVAQISKQARNLQDLVQKLDKQRKIQEKQRQESKKQTTSINKIPPSRLGEAQLPISGIIKIRFNEPDIFGAPSKGLTIEGRGGALVTAPLSGVVRFAGYFKNYGNIVILEHENGYHSLIAGLEKIDTVVGYSISTGEPLGLLHHARSNQKPALYYELRFNGKTINPSKIFTDLG